MRTVATRPAPKRQYKISSEEKRTIDRAAKKIVKQYGKTLKLLARE